MAMSKPRPTVSSERDARRHGPRHRPGRAPRAGGRPPSHTPRLPAALLGAALALPAWAPCRPVMASHAAAPGNPVFRVAYTTFDRPDRAWGSPRFRALERLLRALSAEPDHEPSLEFDVVTGNYYQTLEWLRTGRVDGAVLSPFMYWLAKEVHARELAVIASLEEPGGGFLYEALVAAREDRRAVEGRGVEELLDRCWSAAQRVAAADPNAPADGASAHRDCELHFVSHASTSGFLAPLLNAAAWRRVHVPGPTVKGEPRRFWESILERATFRLGHSLPADTSSGHHLVFSYSGRSAQQLEDHRRAEGLGPWRALTVSSAAHSGPWIPNDVLVFDMELLGEHGLAVEHLRARGRASLQRQEPLHGEAGAHAWRPGPGAELGAFTERVDQLVHANPPLKQLLSDWVLGQAAFTVEETVRLVRAEQARRPEANRRLALVLPGGGVKSAWQAVVLDHLYANHVVNQGVAQHDADLAPTARHDDRRDRAAHGVTGHDPTAPSAEAVDGEDAATHRLTIDHVVGTSGGALMGFFAAQAKDASPGLADLWSGIDVDAVYPKLGLLCWASLVAASLAFFLVVSMAGRPVRRVLEPRQQGAETPTAGGGQRLGGAWLTLLVLVVCLTPLLSGFLKEGTTLLASTMDEGLAHVGLVLLCGHLMLCLRLERASGLEPWARAALAALVMGLVGAMVAGTVNGGLSGARVVRAEGWSPASAGLFAGEWIVLLGVHGLASSRNMGFSLHRPGKSALSYLVLAADLALVSLGLRLLEQLGWLGDWAFELSLDHAVALGALALVCPALLVGLALALGGIAGVTWPADLLHSWLQPVRGPRSLSAALHATGVFVTGFFAWTLCSASALYGNEQARNLLCEMIESRSGDLGLRSDGGAAEQGAAGFCDVLSARPDLAREPVPLTAELIVTGTVLRGDGGACPGTSLEGGDVVYLRFERSEEPGKPSVRGKWWTVPNVDHEGAAAAVLASGAPFPVFPPVEVTIGGQCQVLIDGGYAHNIPILPAQLAGANQALVVESTPRSREGGSRWWRHLVGQLVANLPRLGGLLFDRSQLEDQLAASTMFVARISPPAHRAEDFPDLTEFHRRTIERLERWAEVDLGGRIGRIQSWGLPGQPKRVRARPAADTVPVYRSWVRFDFGESELDAEEGASLDDLRQLLDEDGVAEVQVRLTGHGDHPGSDERNRVIGAERAVAVRRALAHGRLAEARFETWSCGHAVPLVETVQRSAANRRVDIEVASARSVFRILPEVCVPTARVNGAEGRATGRPSRRTLLTDARRPDLDDDRGAAHVR